jgi:RNA polymerase sigma factor (sigma-70 family)
VMGAVGASLGEIEAVYRSRGEAFYKLALARTEQRDLARDAVQEGFARAIRSRDSFRREGSLEAWIARCVINAAHDLVARHDKPNPDAATAGACHARPDSDEWVREAVRRLPRRQREALFLRFYLDFDYITIAATLGVEVGTVSATLHAARAALSNEIREVPQ